MSKTEESHEHNQLLSQKAKNQVFIQEKQSTTPFAKDNWKNVSANTLTFPPARPLDIIGSILGDFGIYQLRTVLIIFLCKIPAAWFMACIIFTAPELYAGTEFFCSDEAAAANSTVITPNQCYMLTDLETNAIERLQCNKFEYRSAFQSVIMQFNLVCGRDILIAWTQYWHLFGVLVGGVLATKLMLRISPRKVYIAGMIAQIICGVVTGYARDFSLHCAGRAISAVCCAMMFTAGQAIFVDLTAGIYRAGIIILYDTFWSIGVIFLPTLASFFQNWSHIYLGITFPTLLLLLLLQWTPDAPRWLLKNGDNPELEYVENLLFDAAKINERIFKLPKDLRTELTMLRANLRTQPAPCKWTKLWQNKRSTIHMIFSHLALSCFIINFMGMLLNIRSFGRDFLVPNTIAMGFSEIVGCFLALHFTLKHNQRKWQCAGVFNIIAGFLGCTGWLFSANTDMDASLKVTLWMIIATIAKSAVSCAQSMLFACMAELMPTASQKQPFVFSVVTFARIWLLTAPFLNVLKRIDTAMSLCAYCVLSIIGGISLCFLLTPSSATTKPVELQQLYLAEADESKETPNRSVLHSIQAEVEQQQAAALQRISRFIDEDEQEIVNV